ncbi:putative spermidine/putrescine transport system permease protein potC, partial [Vibrio parahaemolyticus V-223/04]
RSWLP